MLCQPQLLFLLDSPRAHCRALKWREVRPPELACGSCSSVRGGARRCEPEARARRVCRSLRVSEPQPRRKFTAREGACRARLLGRGLPGLVQPSVAVAHEIVPAILRIAALLRKQKHKEEASENMSKRATTMRRQVVQTSLSDMHATGPAHNRRMHASHAAHDRTRSNAHLSRADTKQALACACVHARARRAVCMMGGGPRYKPARGRTACPRRTAAAPCRRLPSSE